MTKLILLLAVFTAAALAITSVASWISKKNAPRAITAGAGAAVATKSAQDKAMLLAQLRAVVAALFAAVMFASLFRVSIGLSGQVGLPLALTMGLSSCGGFLLFSALPAAKFAAVKTPAPELPTNTASSPSLSSRSSWPSGRLRSLALPATALASYAAFLVVTGLSSSPDEQGRYRVIQWASSNHQSVASPYPGWYYGVPLLLVTLALAGSAYLALRRISAGPSLPDPRMADLDRKWREISTRVVVRLATGALLGYFGGTALVAGQAMINVAWNFTELGHAQPLLSLGIASAVGGAILALTGVVFLGLAIKGAATIRNEARRGTFEPVTTP